MTQIQRLTASKQTCFSKLRRVCGGGDGGANGITRPESHGYAKHCEVNNDCFLVAWERQKHVVSTAWPSGLKSRGNAKSVFNLL